MWFTGRPAIPVRRFSSSPATTRGSTRLPPRLVIDDAEVGDAARDADPEHLLGAAQRRRDADAAGCLRVAVARDEGGLAARRTPIHAGLRAACPPCGARVRPRSRGPRAGCAGCRRRVGARRTRRRRRAPPPARRSPRQASSPGTVTVAGSVSRTPAVVSRTTRTTCQAPAPPPASSSPTVLVVSRPRVRSPNDTAVGVAKSSGRSARWSATTPPPCHRRPGRASPLVDGVGARLHERRLDLRRPSSPDAAGAAAPPRRRREEPPCSSPRGPSSLLPRSTTGRRLLVPRHRASGASEIVVGPTDEKSACVRLVGLPPISTAPTVIAPSEFAG